MADTVPDNPSPYHLDYANIEWQQHNVPLSKQYADIYYSPTRGLQETRYVFLQHNRLEERWQTLPRDTPGHFSIAETGFGTGLNFLAAWQLWQQQAPTTWQLHFVSAEKHPLHSKDLERSITRWPELLPWAKQLLAAYPTLLPGHHVLPLNQGRVYLHLLLGDAVQCFEQLAATSHPALISNYGHKFDAWFLDGFAPAKNPQLWSNALCQQVAQLSKPSTTLATFTAAGHVRRALIKQGFQIEKVPGFNHKREMLRGVLTTNVSAANHSQTPARSLQAKAPWYVSPAVLYNNKRATIIGAGLAGTTSAYALAQRGWQVTLIERHASVAQQASGNPHGILYTKLSPEFGTLSRFALSSYLYALQYYSQLIAQQQLCQGQYDFCGVLQLVNNPKEQTNFAALQQLLAAQPQLVQYVDAKQATQISGIAIEQAAYYFPRAGWISPRDLCLQLTRHSNISTQLHTQAITLHQGSATALQQPVWSIYNEQQQLLNQAEVVIIANSVDALQFSQSAHIPLKPIRGQVSQIPTNGPLQHLKTIVSHEGYITPAIANKNSIGATFDNNNLTTHEKAADHQRNLDALSQALPSLLPGGIASIALSTITGRAAIRCSTPDYLPLIGPLPNQQAFISDYARLRKDANWSIASPGSYLPGLYINVGHGSRGLTSTPLGSELLAGIINNEPLALPRHLIKALNPARFLIRNLIRNKI